MVFRAFFIFFFLLFSAHAQEWKQVSNTKVVFKIKNFGVNVDGSFGNIDIKTNYSSKSLTNNFINSKIHIKSIETGLKGRDNHILKEDFFHEEKYKFLELRSTKITKDKKGAILLFADLTIKGITQKIQIPLEVEEKKHTLKIVADFIINRRDFNIGGGALILSKKVKVRVEYFGEKKNQNSFDNHQQKKKVMNTEEQTSANDWKLIWSDDFNGGEIDQTKWNFQVEKAGRFNEEWQRYTNSNQNAYIENNHLVIKAIHESEKHGHNQYTSARLNTSNKFSFKYGKVSARMKLPFGEGIWPAFWMLGTNIDENGGDTPWPFCGEIDIMELFGFRDDAVVEANIHFANEKGKHDQMGMKSYALKKGIFADDFHVFDLEWDEQKVTWFVDGKRYASYPITAKHLSMFHKDFFLLLNIAVGGTFAGRPDKTTVFPQKMYIDWIRVYQKK